MIQIAVQRTVATCLLLLLSSFAVVEIQANVCFILFQQADNNLEIFIREDNHELILSPAIRDATLTTWVYFDARNFNQSVLAEGWYDDGLPVITEPLEDVYFADGSSPTAKQQGSLYMTWDHDTDKMIITKTLGTETDGDDPDTLYDFLVTALEDCVAKGSTEYMLAMSSHGGGFYGFGADENERRLRRLNEPNKQVISGIQSALRAVSGAPSVLDVLGFDACLMQALDALDDYRNVAKYYLASETTIPGHGWAYDYIDTASSALDMAKNIYTNYLEQKQGPEQQTPKTMAIVDTAAYSTFLKAWDTLAAEFNHYVTKDADLATSLRRARVSSMACESIIDIDATSTSSLDIGSFLSKFKTLCAPDSSSDLATALTAAETAYSAMFVERGVGPGTPSYTGMGVFWPTSRVYQEYPIVSQWLFNSSADFATTSAPNFLDFLYYYYNSAIPAASATSVCTTRTTTTDEPAEAGKLFISVDVQPSNKEVIVTAVITSTTDEVVVDYGIDVSTFLKERRLKERYLDSIRDRESDPFNFESYILPSIRNARNQDKLRRRMQGQDFFIILGGDLLGSYEQSQYSASWDKNFYILSDDNMVEFVYASDLGEGSKAIPIYYFQGADSVSPEDIPLGTTSKDAIRLGGRAGYLSFHTDGESQVVQSFTLYTYTGSTYTETPQSATGLIVPLMPTLASIDGQMITELVGGFNSTIIPWNVDNTFDVVVVPATNYLEALGLESVFMDVSAYDEDTFNAETSEGFDYKTFVLGIDELNGNNPTSPRPAPGSSPTSSASLMLANMVWFLHLSLSLLFSAL